MSAPVSPLLLERYELKYLVPLGLIEPISKHVSIYCEMDYYSKIADDHFYTINSLYLDSPRLHILQSKENAGASKFNLRIRSYGSNPRPPYFFEVKHKLHQFIKKKRVKVYREDWDRLLTGEEPFYEDSELVNQEYLGHFLNMVETYNAKPQILTQYRRKAYLSLIDNYARVTFDRDLRFQIQDNYNLTPNSQKMTHYDFPEIFGDACHNVILELKCERKIPIWFIDLIKTFELVKINFSKFGNAMQAAYGQNDDQLFLHHASNHSEVIS